jgi:hypothetical protein
MTERLMNEDDLRALLLRPLPPSLLTAVRDLVKNGKGTLCGAGNLQCSDAVMPITGKG